MIIIVPGKNSSSRKAMIPELLLPGGNPDKHLMIVAVSRQHCRFYGEIGPFYRLLADLAEPCSAPVTRQLRTGEKQT